MGIEKVSELRLYMSCDKCQAETSEGFLSNKSLIAYCKYIGWVEINGKWLCSVCKRAKTNTNNEDIKREISASDNLPSCFGEYEEEDGGCQTCDLKSECKEKTGKEES